MNEQQQILLDHYHDPRNFGKLDSATHIAKSQNLSCGDEIEVFLEVENDVVKKMKFVGEGCSISIATASMWTEFIVGKTVKEVKALDYEDTLDLIGIPLTTSRLKCAMLSLDAIKKAISNP
ncbi:MAG: iron-sulfur cluster scaffold-like protein [Candidatus Dojkabacteria bacterium]|nr:MAG: iron-sulfur cluster scaffold-like protein [Candidatus Dojkabacteria bacterium]